MGDVSDIAKLPYPVGIDAPDVPAWLMQLVEALDTKVILPAISSGDRDTLYNDVGPGAIVATTEAPWYVWLRTRVSESVLDWKVIYEDTGWLPIPGDAWQTDWADQEVGGIGASGYHRHNGRIDLYLRAVYSGTDVVGNPNNGGNVSDIPIVELPSGARPLKGQVPGTFLASTPGVINVAVAGMASITHVYPGGTLSQGTVLTFAKDWRK